MTIEFILQVVVIILVYHHVVVPIGEWIRKILLLRRVMKSFEGESRKEAKDKAGEWRDD